MKVYGDIESVNLATGQRFRRMAGDGESRLIPEPQTMEKHMHYRNGREAKNGDLVISLDGYSGAVINAVGVLHGAVPGNEYCNGTIAPIQPTNKGACLVDCLHIDDVLAILAEKGLDKRAAGK